MPSNARKNATTSSMTSDPTTRATVRRNVCTATLATLRYARVGIISKRKMRLSSRRVQPPRRVEEVERVAGRRRVDDDQVEARRRRAARAASPSPCIPACRRARRRRCGRSGCRGCVAPVPASRRCASRAGRTSTSCRASTPTARRRARRVPSSSQRLRSISLGSFGQLLEAERVGEPLGGIDRDDARVAALARAFEREHRRGRRLADAAAAAADHDLVLGDDAATFPLEGSVAARHSRSIPRVERVGERVELRRARCRA